MQSKVLNKQIDIRYHLTDDLEFAVEFVSSLTWVKNKRFQGKMLKSHHNWDLHPPDCTHFSQTFRTLRVNICILLWSSLVPQEPIRWLWAICAKIVRILLSYCCHARLRPELQKSIMLNVLRIPFSDGSCVFLKFTPVLSQAFPPFLSFCESCSKCRFFNNVAVSCGTFNCEIISGWDLSFASWQQKATCKW